MKEKMELLGCTLAAFLYLLFSVPVALVSALVTQWLWNTIMYSVFHQPQISYYEATVLDILIVICTQVSGKEKK